MHLHQIRSRPSRVLTWLAIPLLLPLMGNAADWLQEGGPARNWTLPAEPMAAAYPKDQPPLAWSAQVGLGKAAVVVAEGRVYVYGQYLSGTEPDQADDPSRIPGFEDIPGYTNHSGQTSATMPGEPAADAPGADHREGLVGDLLVRCLDAASGKPIWTTKLDLPSMAYLANAAFPLASPLLHEGTLFIHTPTGRLYALDAASGAVSWKLSLYDHGMTTWAWKQCNGCSPVIASGNLIVSYSGVIGDGGSPKRCVVVGAFDPKTGTERWRATIPLHIYRQHASSLGLASIGDQPVILVPCGSGTVGLSAKDGTVLWTFDAAQAMPEVFASVPPSFTGEAATMYRKELPYPYPNLMPLYADGLVIDATSVGHDCAASRTWCIDVTGSPRLIWNTLDFVPHNEMQRSNMVVSNGRLYGFDARGGWIRSGQGAGLSGRPIRPESEKAFQCRDLKTGTLLWSSDELDVQGNEWHANRLILVGDRLISCSAQGLTISIINDRGLKVIGKIVDPAGHKGPILGDPVVSDGRLYIRQLYAESRGKACGIAAALNTQGSLICLSLR